MRSMQGAVKGALVGIPLRTHKHKSVSIADCHPPPGSLDHWQSPERLQAVKCIDAYLGDNSYRSTAKQNVHAIIALR